MNTLNGRTITLFAISLLALLLVSIWLILKPTFVTGSTYWMFAAVVISAAAIAVNAWQNAQAPTSTRQVIQDTETVRR